MAAWVAELLAPLRAGLVGTGEGGENTAVLVRDPDAEGIATVRRLDDQPVVVVHLRDPRSSPIVRDLADRVRLYEAILTTGPILGALEQRDRRLRLAQHRLARRLAQRAHRLAIPH